MLHNNMVSWSMILLLVAAFLLEDVYSYCWQVGWNPGFKTGPSIQQITLAKVRVSWAGIVENRECADQFVVKYWKIRGVVMAKNGREKGWLEGYRLSEKVDNSVNFTDIEVTPKVPYMFQAIAREDKGAVGGVEYNKSPAVLFKTSSDDAAGAPILPGITNEQLIIIVIAILFASVAVTGVIYQLSGYKPKVTIVNDDEEDEDDLLEDKENDDEDTKADEIVGHIKARHIRSSISDITENPDSHISSRRISIISEN